MTVAISHLAAILLRTARSSPRSSRTCRTGLASTCSRTARSRSLYVGKAESLRDRVRSYFHDEAPASTPKIQQAAQMTGPAGLEYILTESPIQALIWENDLVRKEQPRYNTKLRDDKHYPYVRINVQNPWPVARVTSPDRAATARATSGRSRTRPRCGRRSTR